jgi:hypothetical protein
MPKLAELTTEQFQDLLKDFYAEPIHRHKMTEEEILDLAQRLNEKINVPIIDESREEQIFIKIILKIDTFLYDHLPNEFYDVIRSSDRGIDQKEAKRLFILLTKIANEKIDIPYIPEIAEQIALKFVIGIVVKAARKHLDFEKVRKKSREMVVPESNDDIDSLVDD